MLHVLNMNILDLNLQYTIIYNNLHIASRTPKMVPCHGVPGTPHTALVTAPGAGGFASNTSLISSREAWGLGPRIHNPHMVKPWKPMEKSWKNHGKIWKTMLIHRL